MDTSNMDIVYCLKNGETSDELRYSLRSLKNLPHRNVWFYGGCPTWATNVHHVYANQTGTKWQNSTRMLYAASLNENITKNFVWFNDDFYVWNPVKKLEYWYDRTLEQRAADFRTPLMDTSRYGLLLLDVANELKQQGKKTVNYALHIPLVFNRYKFAKMVQKYPQAVPGRSLYCNEYEVGGKQHDDVKIYDNMSLVPPRSLFASTSNKSFRLGKVGQQIKERFPDLCEYEKFGIGGPYSATPFFKGR